MSVSSPMTSEGRGPATRGYRLAANYVAAQFEAAGLAAAGSDGSFLQPVPLRKVDLEPGKSSMSLTRNGRTQILTYAEDYQLDGWVANNFKDAETTVTAPVVFVGSGVTAPELDHDDYGGVDVRGKLVAISFELPVEAAVETVTRQDDVRCANVAAKIRGSDPILREEFVVVTAHLDHLGVSEPVDG